MNLAYFAIQYVPDSLRGEGRNIAVIGAAEGRGYIRALGLGRDGQLDMAEFRAVSGLSVGEAVIYPDWIDYLECVAEADAATPALLARELGRLSTFASPFVMGSAGEAEIGAQEGPEKAMDRVFERVVGHPPADRVDRFPEALERFLYVSELQSHTDFWRNPEIELETASGATTLHFDFALVDAPAVGFRIVRYTPDQSKARRELNAALAGFREAWESGFLSAGRSAILTDRTWPEHYLAEPLLRARIMLINVAAADAPQRVHALLRQRAKGRRA